MKTNISFTEIEKITAGNAQALKELLKIFVNENTKNVKKLEEYLATENWDELKKTAHKIKSSLALVGMMDYHALAEDLEKTAGTNVADTKKKIAQVTEACQNAINQTEIKLKQLA